MGPTSQGKDVFREYLKAGNVENILNLRGKK
jgi:hypothetical protein